mmetsp:Transcript_302/g.940  ORF Transcript_302/g.940 Transcript_302/m.940 type:complete len:1013 (-) Transcript_302:47-3085(-)
MAAALSLSARPGDPQSAKVAIAAAASATPLDLVTSAAAKRYGPFGSVLELRTATGSAFHEPNAAARVAAAGVLPASEGWLAWEERVLRPAVYAFQGTEQRLLSAVAELADGVARAGKFLGGTDALSLADIAVYCTLAAGKALAGLQVPAAVTSYLSLVSQTEAVKAGLATAAIEGGAPMATVLVEDRRAAAAAAPKVPLPGSRNILVTSALPYVNNVPHLGNIIGCVLSADCYARYCRARGYNTIFVCGTDEYGTATETKAMEEGLTCAQICDKYNAIHASIYEWFECAFDNFGRTPTRAQTEICQEIYRDVDSAGCVVEKEVEQLYSEALRKYLADRFVEGTCPKCGYEDARGDQCDNCQTLLNPTELIRPRCKFTGTTPVLKKTKHMYLDLPKLSSSLEAYVSSTSKEGGWTSNCVTTTNSWLSRGLQHRAITRDLVWGTPVPRPGYEDKVFYVWFDAPIGYISITANYTPDWRKWWCNPDEVELVQFMGKDNIPFHTIIFPATLLATGKPWTMMKRISVTEYLNYEGGKFSKSRGVGVFGNDAKDTGIPVEVWRYYLLGNRPEASDTDFKWADLAAKNNAELNNNLGNFILRALSFTASRFDGKVPAVCEKGMPEVIELSTKVAALVKEYVDAMEAAKIRSACATAMAISKAGNLFFQEQQPWVVFKTDSTHCGTLLAACMGLVRVLATVLAPFMPSISKRIATQLGLDPDQLLMDDGFVQRCERLHELLPVGHPLGAGKPEPLFRGISDEEVEALRLRFSGSQADRKEAAAAAAATGSSSGASSGGPAPKGKDKTTAKAPDAAAKGKEKAAKDKAAPEAGGGVQKADKKEKKDKAPAPAKVEPPVDVSRLNLRVGLIKKAGKHPEADSLYVEEIDCGEDAPRTVVSGLVKYIPEEEMQNRRVVLVTNLKPANMRGIKSQAMVLCAASTDGTKVEIVTPPEGAALGERVMFEGYPGEADEQLNPKKRVFESVAPDLVTDAQCVATYKGVPFMTSAGPCTVTSITGGGIK